MLDESPLKSDSPSKTTTWLVIFLIMIFLGLLGGQFFFTWHGRNKSGQDMSSARQATFGTRPTVGAGAGNGSRTTPNEPIKPRSQKLN